MTEHDTPDAIGDTADAELVLRTRSGDSTAFGELWRRHYRSGLTVARSVTSSIDADDLVQEAYARIYQSILKGGGPTTAFRAYLFTSIRNTAAGWGRARREVPVDELENVEDPTTSEQHTAEALDRSLTHQAFRSLPTRWQEVLWYTEIEQMKPAEVGPLLGLKATAVAQLAFRAREGLREAWIQAHLRTLADGSDCQWTIERLGAYSRNNLGTRDKVKLEEHLADCARCSIVAAEAKHVSGRLALVLLPLTVGITGAAAYLASIQGGGAPLVAVAAMPSTIMEGAVTVTGGAGSAGLVTTGAATGSATGFGSTAGGSTAGGGAGAAAGGAAGTGTAAGGTAAAGAAAAGTAATAGALSGVGAIVGLVAAGVVLVGAVVAGAVVLPSIVSPEVAAGTPVETVAEQQDLAKTQDAPEQAAPVPSPSPSDIPVLAPIAEPAPPVEEAAPPAAATPPPAAVVVPPVTIDPGPVDPGPVDPVDPGPVDPVDPGPVDPVDPGPVDPVDPVDPVLPSGAPQLVSWSATGSPAAAVVTVVVSGVPGATVQVAVRGQERTHAIVDESGNATLVFSPTGDDHILTVVDFRYVAGDAVGSSTSVWLGQLLFF